MILKLLLIIWEYSLPGIDDIFANFAVRQNFSIVDSLETYLQKETDNSGAFINITMHKEFYHINKLVSK